MTLHGPVPSGCRGEVGLEIGHDSGLCVLCKVRIQGPLYGDHRALLQPQVPTEAG